MFECGFPNGSFENKHLVRQRQRITMTEVDLHLCRTFFVNQGVDIQTLCLTPVIDIFKQRIVFILRHQYCTTVVRIPVVRNARQEVVTGDQDYRWCG